MQGSIQTSYKSKSSPPIVTFLALKPFRPLPTELPSTDVLHLPLPSVLA
jgi:hypothetical protein